MKVEENTVLICGRNQADYEEDWYGYYTIYTYIEDAFNSGQIVQVDEYEKTRVLQNGEKTVVFDEYLGYCTVANVDGRAIFLHDNGRRMLDDEGNYLDDKGCRLYDDEDSYGTYSTTDV